MKKCIIALFTLTSSQLFAFHAITEILPSGKILICRDSDQRREGNVVTTISKKPSKSNFNKVNKIGEFTLPEAGQKIKLIHRDYHRNGKVLGPKHTKDLGFAIVSSESLEGEDRSIYPHLHSKANPQTEKIIKISKADAVKIQTDCIVAIPESGLQVNEKAAVSW
jgi:hypothetical protein